MVMQQSIIYRIWLKITRQRDPRTLMGTYSKLDDNTINALTLNTTLIDPSAPIYQHTYQINYTFSGSKSQYLFKANNIGAGGVSTGWCLSEDLPEINEVTTVFMTCFEENLFDCQYNQWYWGYDKYQYSIPTVKVMGNECQSMYEYIHPFGHLFSYLLVCIN